MNKKFLAATFTLSGSIIGAGILGLPFAFSESGFFPGMFWLIFLGLVIIFVNLSLGEVTLRTKKRHQLTGYAEEYLGQNGKRIMFFAVIFGIYSALLAYLIGEGQSFSRLLPGNINPTILGIAFWFAMTLLLKDGLRGLKKVEMYGVSAIILIILGIFMAFIPQINLDNINTSGPAGFASPVGVILFALLGFTAIPELRQEIKGKESLFKKAILIGSLIPIILYIIFSFTTVGVMGSTINEVATLSFGPILTILGIFTMLTSYLVLSYGLNDTFKYDLKLSKKQNFFYTSLLPLLAYLIFSGWKHVRFISVISVGGVVSGGLTGILILLINKKSKNTTRNKKAPEINMKLSWPLIILISAIFIIGTILEFIK